MVWKNSNLVLLVLLFCFSGQDWLAAQNAKEIFGKNKVQFSDDQFDWWQHETNNFITYYYGKSREPAKFCIEIAESENAEIQKLFEFHLKDKIELVVYADASDHAQSNINLDGVFQEKTWESSPKLKDQKILLYFEGDHEKLRKMLRAGIIKLYFSSLFDGTALQDAVQKVISLKLPDWFEAGLILYLTDGWNQQTELEFLENWDHKPFKKLAKKFPELTGLSFWNFLVNTYGQQSVANWLYLTRIQKDFAEAARIVFSEDFTNLMELWFQYYHEINRNNPPSLSHKADLLKFKLKEKEKIISLKYENPFQKRILLATHQFGKNRVRILDPATGQLKTIFCQGSKSKLYQPDNNYPHVCQDGSGKTRYIAYEKANRVHLKITQDNQVKTSIKLPEDIQRVYSMAYYDKDHLVFSANIRGQSDIVLYALKSRQYKNLTEDLWDDLDAEILRSGPNKKIFFRSNRTTIQQKTGDSSDIKDLPLTPFGIQEIELNEKYNIESRKIYFSHKEHSVKKWLACKSGLLAELENANQLQWYHINSDSIAQCLFEKHPEHILCSENEDQLLFLINRPKEVHIHQSKLTTVSAFLNALSAPMEEVSSASDRTDTITETDTLYFQSPFGNPPNLQLIFDEFKQKRQKVSNPGIRTTQPGQRFKLPVVQPFLSHQSIAYRNKFYFEDISTTLNNELLFSGLNTFSGTSQDYEPPEIGILFKTKILEILENYHLEAGIRIPTSFNGLESYLLLENRLPRFDHTYALYHKINTETLSNTRFGNIKQQTNTFILNHQLKYPLDHYTSVRAISTLRNDHVAYLSTNSSTLFDSSSHTQQRIGTRLEFVYDNALDLGLNLKSGWQFKLFFEASKRFELNFSDRTRILPGSLLLTGFDARWHLPILKKSTFSQRAFSYISFGSQRILYHLGGTENWLVPKYENQNPLATSGEYVYSALATEVRGHSYGTRKAASVFGYSAEIRMPLFLYLISNNYKNSILRNFQLMLFYDAAVVWDGFVPEIHKTSTVDYQAENPVVKINLQYNREPWIAGSGFGFRTSLFGYYLRIDHAWQVNNFSFTNPNWIFSLGLDF
ncbi:MAG: hypothetical protein IPM34_01425 [Saprospiraceae bacterium]|nr:hypothetical protein [Saprospiraceae bacterium]